MGSPTAHEVEVKEESVITSEVLEELEESQETEEMNKVRRDLTRQALPLSEYQEALLLDYMTWYDDAEVDRITLLEEYKAHRASRQ